MKDENHSGTFSVPGCNVYWGFLMDFTRRTVLKAASISPVLFNVARGAKATDIRIEDIRFSYQDYTYRVPIKFGGTVLDRATIFASRRGDSKSRGASRRQDLTRQLRHVRNKAGVC